MQDQEMKRIITSSFQPYYCAVEFRPVNGDEGLGVQVSDKDDILRYTAKATLKALRADFAWHIANATDLIIPPFARCDSAIG